MSDAQRVPLNQWHSRSSTLAANLSGVVHTRSTLLAVVPDDVSRRVSPGGNPGPAVWAPLVSPVVRMHPLRFSGSLRDRCRNNVPHIAGKVLSPAGYRLTIGRSCQ